ncbi:heme-binding protein [Mycobacterium sp. pUA109]|uniref:heme-binding protein n=1 Tax=Mycobacterium sp. pUA109 TaxID=3238982 RepID=UPI00351BE4EC
MMRKTMLKNLGIAGGCLLGAAAAGIIAAPTAAAEPDCSPAGLSNTVNTTTGSARQYLAGHPGADAVVTQAISQPRPEAASNVRSYFTAHPQEYYELRGILAPIGDAQRQCNTTVLPPELASAYDAFMAG